MLDIESWLSLWSRAVLDEFGDRVRFLGIQGSRARGEAREDSDIDVVTSSTSSVLRTLQGSDARLRACRTAKSSAASSRARLS